jgi:hypothetical protein
MRYTSYYLYYHFMTSSIYTWNDVLLTNSISNGYVPMIDRWIQMNEFPNYFLRLA